ncbi:Retrovirus-related Pol polyprotein from transposon [Trichinella spiralis]|uniref:Retrovirus-related Pol polyprotein from transposon n=1 Tax=Trichinella spiralis TaxID=6334 RepID=A0ABR3KDF4_TRISP
MLLGRKANCDDTLADLANQLFLTDAAHAAVVQATVGNEHVQPTPTLDEEMADSRCAVSVVGADTSSDIDRLIEALRRVLTEEIRGPIMPPHQQHRRAYRRPTAARPRESPHSVRYVNQVVPSSGATDHNYRRIIDEMLPSVEELDAHSRNAMRSVLWKYRRCIATSDEDLGHTELASHRIDTRNAAPVKVPPRRLPPPQRHDVQRMVTDMFSRNIIEPANSPCVESPSLLPRRYLLRPWKKWHPQGACQFLTSKHGCEHSPPTPRCRCCGVGSPQAGGPVSARRLRTLTSGPCGGTGEGCSWWARTVFSDVAGQQRPCR